MVFGGIFLCSCSDEHSGSQIDDRNTVTVNLSLNILGLNTDKTKAMSAVQESTIDSEKLEILVFEQVGDAEIFRFKADIVNLSIPQITLNVPAKDSDKKFRFVVLANIESKTLAEGISKQDALSEYVFNNSGKWNASSSDFMKIPMWGELNLPISIDSDKSISILLHRALARVDVGLLFKHNNPDPVTGQEYPQKETDKESVYGIDNFKIKDIRVYRTCNKTYAASSADLMTGNEVTTPSIPPSANYNSDSGTEYETLAEADKHPLVYTLLSGSDSYIREIYIPESDVIDEMTTMDNVSCLVIGGYYGSGNTTQVTYYRADFASYTNGKATAYRPILRNHQYVFDIKTVNSPGFETPEQALKSINSAMELDVIDWNQIPLDSYIQGYYFMSIQEREIWMPAHSFGGSSEITYTVPYNTNLELDGSGSKQFNLSWQSSPETSPFEVTVDYTNKQFIFKAKQENIGTGSVRTDILTVEVENFKFTIKVNQESFDLSYFLNCDSIKVHGKYTEDIPLNYSNYITITVNSPTDISGSNYEIKTIEKNGIYFQAKGTFSNPQTVAGPNPYAYKVVLEGYGTPVNETGEKILTPFYVTIVSNSADQSECSNARIVVSYKTKRILTIGANASYTFGYVLEANSASRAFIDASVNFGTSPGSTVAIEENQLGNAFTIEVMTAGSGMTGEVINYNSLKNKLNTFKPDIILTGQAINYYTGSTNTNVIDLLSSFVDEGGVFLMFNEYYPISASIQAMVQKIMGTSVTGNNQSIGTNLSFKLSGSEDDPIINGPFGNMQEKIWGADGHEMYGCTNLPSETIIYSLRSDGYANVFRHATKPFFFIGDGGFISNYMKHIGGTYLGSNLYYPFAIDASHRPVPRTNYGPTRYTIYNSLIFGNIIAWAVDYAEMQGIEYPETGNKFE